MIYTTKYGFHTGCGGGNASLDDVNTGNTQTTNENTTTTNSGSTSGGGGGGGSVSNESETTDEKKIDWKLIALIGAAGLVLYFYFKKK